MKLKYEFDGYDYEYEPSDNIINLLFDLFKEEYGLEHVQAKYIVDDFQMRKNKEDLNSSCYDNKSDLNDRRNNDDVLEDVIGEKYMDALLEHYEEEAREQFEEDRECDKDTEGYYGTSRRYD